MYPSRTGAIWTLYQIVTELLQYISVWQKLETFSFEGIFVLLSLISYIALVCNYSLGTVNNFIEISYTKLNNFTLGMVVDTLQLLLSIVSFHSNSS